MAKAKAGDKVKVHYTGTLTDGTVFDSSAGSDPLEFSLGGGQVIPGFDAGITGMKIGEKKQISIPCKEAYGPREDELVLTIERDKLSDDLKPEVGMMLGMGTPEGHTIPIKVIEVNDDTIKADANHPLAGQDLTFDLELVGIA